ncbi:phage tail tape measure protein [Campylobacter sp. CLAX-22107-21]|uniref:phage tail tape measure protein n=1 Tax=Campylobacter devanensis TaxID=3161138 RepID=UPI002EB23EB1|nr:phage tail tape measure protein [Campylobacter sp. CLAX-22107-21]
MQVGLSINLALQGITSIKTCQNSFNKLSQAIQNAGEKVKHLKKDLNQIKLSRLKVEGIEESMNDFKSKMIDKVALAGSVILPIKTAIDFEKSMADVRKVVDFETKDELKKFEGEILALTRQIPLSASELASITASGGQLGIAKENLLEFTTIAAKMGVAFDMGADEAGDSMGKMMNIFNMDIKAVSSLGDAINHLSDNSASKAKEIVEVLKRIGGTAKTIGLSAKEASSLASAFISLGKTPELAATSADTLMKTLGNLKINDKTKEAFSSLGLDPELIAANMAKAPQETIMLFLQKAKELKGSEQLKLLTDIFGDGFAGDIALLVNGLDTYKKAIKDLDSDYSGSMDKEFKNKSDTTANALQTLKNAITEISINLGSLFLPAIAGIARGIGAALAPIANFINAHETLAKIVGASLIGFVSFAVVLPAFGFLISGMVLTLTRMKIAFHLIKIAIIFTSNALKINTLIIKTWSAIVGIARFASLAFGMTLKSLSLALLFTGSVFKGLATIIKITSLALLTNPIGLILSAIALVAGLVITNWDKVKEWFLSFGAWLKGVSQPVIDWFSKSFGGMFEWIGQKIEFFSKAIKSVSSFLGFDGNDKSNDLSKFDTLDNQSSLSSSLGLKRSDKSSDLSKFDTLDNQRSYNFTKESSLPSSNHQSVVVNLNGDFNIATNNGKFDLKEFEIALTQSIKRAIANDVKNMQNRSVIG